MKRCKGQYVAHTAFRCLCNILKEEGKIGHKVIAIDAGIDFAIFSRIYSGKQLLTSNYIERLYQCFAREEYHPYAFILKKRVIQELGILGDLRICKRIENYDYVELLNYLFYELDEGDIEAEYQMIKSFQQSVINDVEQRFNGKSVPISINEVPFGEDYDLYAFVKKQATVIEYPAQNGSMERVLLIFCTKDWIPIWEVITKLSDINQVDYHLLVRYEDQCLSHFYKQEVMIMNNSEFVEIEGMSLKVIRNSVQELGEHIYSVVQNFGLQYSGTVV